MAIPKDPSFDPILWLSIAALLIVGVGVLLLVVWDIPESAVPDVHAHVSQGFGLMPST